MNGDKRKALKMRWGVKRFIAAFMSTVLIIGNFGVPVKGYAEGEEDKWMTACNKWLLAHEESSEAKNGAYVGLTGVNPDIADLI